MLQEEDRVIGGMPCAEAELKAVEVRRDDRDELWFDQPFEETDQD